MTETPVATPPSMNPTPEPPERDGSLNTKLHTVLSVVTVGLWLPIWGILYLEHLGKPAFVQGRRWWLIGAYIAFWVIVGAMQPSESTKAKKQPHKDKPAAASPSRKADKKPTTPTEIAKRAPKVAANPVKTLERDLRKNLEDALGNKTVRLVECDTPAGSHCLVAARIDEGFALVNMTGFEQRVGDVFNELFRDTTANYITFNVLASTTDDLGHEDPNAEIGTVGVKRTNWNKVEWKNLKYTKPGNVRKIAEIYGVQVNF